MYESYYRLKEKPFALLPDPGFLFLSDKHRMALTLLEYGLMDHAGFTVISGEIGAGKTTLIRHLLNNMEQEYTVGLITNTHRSFGELLEWILLAFNLDHEGMNKVGMYQRFVDFIIGEYAQNRRTVLIVDEAQNMGAETLEELRMLSNINADKDQALQVVLVGQRELRETLQRPDLVQFAQRITVDYHLEPLSETETEGYIRHRMEVAGGDPATFSPDACKAVHRYSNGVPRLINLLCDTALVYGFAEQLHTIGPKLVTDVAREKQRGGIFPVYASAEQGLAGMPDDILPEPRPEPRPATSAAETVAAEEPQAATDEDAAADTSDGIHEVSITARPPTTADAGSETVTSAADGPPASPPASTPAIDMDALYRWEHGHAKKKVRAGVCATGEGSRRYLSRLLESYGFDVTFALPFDAAQLLELNRQQCDVLVVDRDPAVPLPADLARVLDRRDGPVLYIDAATTSTSLREGNPDFGLSLAESITALLDPPPPDLSATR